MSPLSSVQMNNQEAYEQEMSSGHKVVDTKGPPDGRFTFTSHEAGMYHRLQTWNQLMIR